MDNEKKVLQELAEAAGKRISESEGSGKTERSTCGIP